MDKLSIVKIAREFSQNSGYNYVSSDDAISEELVGMQIFDEPIFAFGTAEDKGFKALKNPSVIGEHFMLPEDWLPGAKTVISYFFPFTARIVDSNKEDARWPSSEWLHGRIEGQRFIVEFSKYLNSRLIEEGYESIAPSLDLKFWSSKEESEIKSFSSNWSERHVAFVCGLGTFGLSKGLITRKGMAGRLGSIVTRLNLEPDGKNYTDVYEYCTVCGACARKCPVGAISVENGKDHKKCSDFLNLTAEKYKPRYGCGKCQVAVPCERKIPKNCREGKNEQEN